MPASSFVPRLSAGAVQTYMAFPAAVGKTLPVKGL
jgi:hypothetical protein